MAVYVLSFEGESPQLCAHLKATYPVHHQVHDRAFAIATRGTSAKDLLLSASIPDEEKSGVVIFQVTADYWGYSKKAFWDWLADAFRSDVNG